MLLNAITLKNTRRNLFFMATHSLARLQAAVITSLSPALLS
jgi:hypothetical protein